MLKKYEIEIEETLQTIVEIEANSIEEAINIVNEEYRNGENLECKLKINICKTMKRYRLNN